MPLKFAPGGPYLEPGEVEEPELRDKDAADVL